MVVALSTPRSAEPGSVPSAARAPLEPRQSRRPGQRPPSLREWVTQHRKFIVRVAAGVVVSISLVGGIVTKVGHGSPAGSSKGVSVLNALPRVPSGSAARTAPLGTQDPSKSLIESPTVTQPLKGVVVAEVVAPTTVARPMVVHAAGAVVVPGVYVFAVGARVGDLVSAAGGPSPDADTDRLNLAAALTDGSRVFVPRRGQQVPPILAIDLDAAQPTDRSSSVNPGSNPAGKSAADGGSIAKVNLNSATLEQLDSLPGVGPATATAILEHRAKIGRFRSVTQLMDIPGIGEAKFAALRSRVMV